MKYLNKMIIISILCSSFIGCASKAGFVYNPTLNPVTDSTHLNKVVVVNPLQDNRPYKNTNAIFIYLIPVAPFGFSSYNRPDDANMFLTHSSYNLDASEDFSKAIKTEFENHKVFNETFFSERENEPNVDLVLCGKIEKTKYDNKMITYGLSVYGPLLWFFGLPAGTAKNTISLTLELKNLKTKNILWEYKIEKEWGTTVGLYYNWAAEFDGFPKILQEGLQEAIQDLKNTIDSKPIEYWNS